MGDWVYVPGVREKLIAGETEYPAKLVHGKTVSDIMLTLPAISEKERRLLLIGCLINHYAAQNAKE